MTQDEHVYAICYRPAIVGGVISGENVKTIEGYAFLQFDAAIFSSGTHRKATVVVQGGGCWLGSQHPCLQCLGRLGPASCIAPELAPLKF